MGRDSPVSTERSNFASDEMSMKRTSAGSLLPDLMETTSPGTRTSAGKRTSCPSRVTWQCSGSMSLMDDMTRDVDQSWNMAKPAWMKKTARSTMASACLSASARPVIISRVAHSYQVGQRRGLAKGPPRDEDEDAADEEDAAEALEEVAEDGERLVRLGRRRRVPAVLLKPALGLVVGEAARRRRDESLGHVGRRDGVPFKVTEVWRGHDQLLMFSHSS
ncbi:hypothetical protein G6O67_005970 [Ophiocordyceps sinensis]|uniref:Uncharacterized protein n=1 Tax=Ophiocordyceps sinensis TaxID=72228 RepID=A0A8H4LYH9_9HYPO|nr:hypothetical protein G6O67_005970 [Ophiocordyceps sinensis]